MDYKYLLHIWLYGVGLSQYFVSNRTAMVTRPLLYYSSCDLTNDWYQEYIIYIFIYYYELLLVCKDLGLG